MAELARLEAGSSGFHSHSHMYKLYLRLPEIYSCMKSFLHPVFISRTRQSAEVNEGALHISETFTGCMPIGSFDRRSCFGDCFCMVFCLCQTASPRLACSSKSPHPAPFQRSEIRQSASLSSLGLFSSSYRLADSLIHNKQDAGSSSTSSVWMRFTGCSC